MVFKAPDMRKDTNAHTHTQTHKHGLRLSVKGSGVTVEIQFRGMKNRLLAALQFIKGLMLIFIVTL